MPYPSVDWGQNLIEGLRTGAYLKNLREQAMQERMLQALREKELSMQAPAYEALAEQRRGSAGASRALEDLRRGPQSEYWEEYAGYRKSQGENVDSPADRAWRASEKNRSDYQARVEAARIRGAASGPLGSPEMQMLRFMLGTPEESRPGVLGVLGEVNKARNAGKPESQFQSTYKGQTPVTKGVAEIERELSTKYRDLPPPARDEIDEYAKELEAFTATPDYLRGNRTPPDFYGTIARIREITEKIRQLGAGRPVSESVKFDLPGR